MYSIPSTVRRKVDVDTIRVYVGGHNNRQTQLFIYRNAICGSPASMDLDTLSAPAIVMLRTRRWQDRGRVRFYLINNNNYHSTN